MDPNTPQIRKVSTYSPIHHVDSLKGEWVMVQGIWKTWRPAVFVVELYTTMSREERQVSVSFPL
jgi:hypothetical protein